MHLLVKNRAGPQRVMVSKVYVFSGCTFWSDTVMVSKLYVLSACTFWSIPWWSVRCTFLAHAPSGKKTVPGDSQRVVVSKVYVLSACTFWSNTVMVSKVYGISTCTFWSNTVPGGSHRTMVSKVKSYKSLLFIIQSIKMIYSGNMGSRSFI